MRLLTFVALTLIAVFAGVDTPARAQDNQLVIATVTRPPFSMVENGRDVGFSIDLFDAIAKDLGLSYRMARMDKFGDMLMAVQDGTADGAIANISITATREEVMDFSQPIFESGLRIMLPYSEGGNSIISALFTLDILIAVLLAFGLLFGGGMLMWAFERRAQEYFNRPMREAMFPSFWWALNLVVNGGFEERMPRSRPGRVFAVLMVVASLFIVSVFVAKITAAMTVEAIQTNVSKLSDLDSRRVGTIQGATAASFLELRGIGFQAFDDLADLLNAFEEGTLDAVVFDGPILAYYAQTDGVGKARLVGQVFKPENYGMALPSGSPLREDLNRSLLKLREDGTYERLVTRWFGAGYSNR